MRGCDKHLTKPNDNSLFFLVEEITVNKTSSVIKIEDNKNMPEINPYYDPAKLGLIMLEFDQPNMDYEYNTLCFWVTESGQVYSASDSGCSCPTPFEYYSGKSQKQVIQKLERVGSLEQAIRIFDSWNKSSYGNKPLLPADEKLNLIRFIHQNLK